MSKNTIKTADLTRTIPRSIAENPEIKALGKLIEEQIKKIDAEIEKNKIFSDVMSLDERTCDILAYDLNILWYDYDLDLGSKRSIIRDCIKVYKKLGTAYATKKAVSNLFLQSTVREWFETGGEPYTFEIELDVSQSGGTKEQQRALIERIQFYKNLRSHLAKIIMYLKYDQRLTISTLRALHNSTIVYPQLVEKMEDRVDIKIQHKTLRLINTVVYPVMTEQLHYDNSIIIYNSNNYVHDMIIYPQTLSDILCNPCIRIAHLYAQEMKIMAQEA